jgi:hypothetical protein
MPYQNIVFMQGDDASEPLAILHHRAVDSDSVVWEWPTGESVADAFTYMSQWDYGDAGETYPATQAGNSDWQETSADGRYLLTYNVGLGYIGLERIMPEPEAGQ